MKNHKKILEKRGELNLVDVFMSIFEVKNEEISNHVKMREAESVDIFKNKLKTYLFKLTFN